MVRRYTRAEKIAKLGAMKAKTFSRFIDPRDMPEPLISVIYTPDCNCPVEQFVIVDTYPMVKQFLSRCPKCDLACLMKLAKPLIFHYNQGKDFTLEELKMMDIPPTWQKGVLEKYKKMR